MLAPFSLFRGVLTVDGMRTSRAETVLRLIRRGHQRDGQHGGIMADVSIFKGLSAFPLTPADTDGVVDTEVFARMLERLVVAGVDSIAVLGSTGTYARYLDRSERSRPWRPLSRRSRPRVPSSSASARCARHG